MVEMLRRNLESRAKAYGMEALANDTEVSRQALHSFFKGGDMKLSNLEKLVQRLGWSLSLDPVDTSKDVLGNLKEYGAPLVADQPHVYYSLEEALYKALEFSREDARIASVLPYFLLQRAYKLNSDKLFSYFKDQKELYQLLGYYLEVALSYKYRAPLHQLLGLLKRKTKKLDFLYLRKRDEGRDTKTYERFKNDPAKKWKVLTRDNLEDLLDRFKKWDN